MVWIWTENSCPNLLLLDLHLPKRDGTGWMPQDLKHFT
jgi:hypothetical protein